MCNFGSLTPKNNKMKKIISSLIILLISSFAIAQNASLDPIGYWPFNGNANDESGYDNHGIVYGASLTEDRFGNPDKAYQFDGIDDYILVPNDSILNPLEELTICAWFRTTPFDGVGNNAIVEKPYHYHGYPYYQFHLGITGYTYDQNKGRFGADLSVSEEWNHFASEPGSYMMEQWYLLSMTYDQEEIKYYVNEELINVIPTQGYMDDYGQDIYIGKFGNLNEFTPGAIDDIRMYDRALTIEKIYAIYSKFAEVERPDVEIAVESYPNPCESFVSIRLPQDVSDYSVEIFNSNGMLMESFTNRGSNFMLDLEKYDNGVYSVRIVDEKTKYQGNTRFIKMN
jgi:hypothetical protein